MRYMFIYFIVSRGTFGTVTNNNLKILQIGVLGDRAPCVRNTFPLGTDLCSINMVRVVTFVVRVAKGAVMPAVLSRVPAVIASAVAVLSVIAITPSSSSACTVAVPTFACALSGLLELLSSDKLPFVFLDV